MTLNCPQCRNAVPMNDVDLSTELAKCRACQTVFSFQNVAKHQGATAAFRPRQPIPAPKKFRVDEGINELRVRWNLPRLPFVGLALFCTFWDGFLVMWYTIGIVARGPWLMFAFPILHLAVGVWLTYFTLGGLFNSHSLTLANGELLTKQRPFPWKRALRLSVMQLQQAYCVQRTNRKNIGYSVYDVRAILDDGSDITLATDLPSPQQALYLEQQIESRLGITDRAVSGELERT